MLNHAAPTSPTPVLLRDRLGISQVRRAYTASNVRRRTGCIRIWPRQCSCGGAVDEPSFDAFSTTFAAGGGSEVATPYSSSAPPVSSRAESRYSVWRTLSTSDVASASLWLSGWVSAAHAHAILQGRASAAHPPTTLRASRQQAQASAIKVCLARPSDCLRRLRHSYRPCASVADPVWPRLASGARGRATARLS